MDSFFASVEQAVNPHLKGKPVIVGGRPDKKRTIVCAASYEAKQFGIESGMPSWQAYKLCPGAVFIPADTARYLSTSEGISGLLKYYTNKVEEASIDEFYMDLSNMSLNEAIGVLKEIKEKIKRTFGITCSIGIAPNKMLSKLASKLSKPDGLLVIQKEDIPFLLENLPIEKIAGIGPNIKERLNNLSVYTCGELSKFPRDLLIRYFGIYGGWLYNASRGEDSSPVLTESSDIQKSIGHSITVAKDLYAKEEISAYLLMLSEMVGFRLRKGNLLARIIRITIRYKDLGTFSKQKTLFNPINSTFDIYKNALYLFSYIKLKAPVRLLGVSLTSLIKDSCQGILFEKEKGLTRLSKVIDSINERFGEFTITYAKTLTI